MFRPFEQLANVPCIIALNEALKVIIITELVCAIEKMTAFVIFIHTRLRDAAAEVDQNDGAKNGCGYHKISHLEDLKG